jgi:hypothetical protein
LIRLPRGRYAINGTILTPRSGQEPTISLISYPELKLDRDTVQTLDARVGKAMSITTDNPAARGGLHEVDILTALRECGCTSSYGTLVDPRFYEVYAATVPGTRSDSFAMSQLRRAEEPMLELLAQVRQPFEVPVGIVSNRLPAAQETLPAVYGGSGTPEDLAKIDAKGKLVVAEVPGSLTQDDVVARTVAIAEAGAKLAMLVPADATLAAATMAPEGPETEPALPTISGAGPTVQRFVALVKAGEVPAAYASRPYPEHRYELQYGVSNELSTAQVYRPMTNDLVAVQAAYHKGADLLRVDVCGC